MQLYCYALLTLVGVSQALEELPWFIKPCAPRDPNFKECTLKHGNEAIIPIANGDKTYKLPVADPFEIKEININSGPRQAGLSLLIQDIKFHGMKDAVLTDTDFNFEEKHITLEFNCPRNMLIGNYNVSGRVLLLPVFGNGVINVTAVDSTIKYSVNYFLHEEDGNTFIRIKKHHATFEPKKAYIHLTNLFNGDKLLGNQMNEILNDNWRSLFKDFAPPIADAIAQTIGKIVNSVAFDVPLDIVFIGGIPK